MFEMIRFSPSRNSLKYECRNACLADNLKNNLNNFIDSIYLNNSKYKNDNFVSE